MRKFKVGDKVLVTEYVGEQWAVIGIRYINEPGVIIKEVAPMELENGEREESFSVGIDSGNSYNFWVGELRLQNDKINKLKKKMLEG